MGKRTVEVSINGKMWDIVKQGITFPINDDDLEKEPEISSLKLDSYELGRKLFLTSVKLLSDAILPKISPDSEGIDITLSVDEK